MGFGGPTNAAPMPVKGGPWGGAMDVIMCLLPIIFLVVVTLMPHPMPTVQSLPCSALMIWVIRMAYLSASPQHVASDGLRGMLSAITPISIIAGAIFLFKSMESANVIFWMRAQMQRLTNGHHVAEIMLIGWAFAYLIEGASGFGTPVALAAPILVSVGHPKLETVQCLLLMNIFCPVFGAVGTPVWFGFGGIVDSDADLLEIGLYSGIGLCSTAILLMPFVVRLLVPWPQVRANIVFIMLSTLSCSAVGLAVSSFSYDFPTLLGGVVGVGVTALLVRFRVGMSKGNGEYHLTTSHSDPAAHAHHSTVAPEDDHDEDHHHEKPINNRTVRHPVSDHEHHAIELEDAITRTRGGSAQPPADGAQPSNGASGEGVKTGGGGGSAGPISHAEVSVVGHAAEDRIVERTDPIALRVKTESSLGHFLLRTSPIWMTVLLLVLTRVQEIGLKKALRSSEPRAFEVQLGSLGKLWLSHSLVLGLDMILNEADSNWEYEFLYVPAFIPFAISGSLALLLYRKELASSPREILRNTAKAMEEPVIALLGALALVEMLRSSGDDISGPAYVIGVRVSSAISHAWVPLAGLIGGLGSFFSGSVTVSNLTFGAVQRQAARMLGVNANAMCALQTLGGAFGHAICLNNIIAASTVVGLKVSEGVIMKRTGPLFLAAWAIATAVLLPFVYSTK